MDTRLRWPRVYQMFEELLDVLGTIPEAKRASVGFSGKTDPYQQMHSYLKCQMAAVSRGYISKSETSYQWPLIRDFFKAIGAFDKYEADVELKAELLDFLNS